MTDLYQQYGIAPSAPSPTINAPIASQAGTDLYSKYGVQPSNPVQGVDSSLAATGGNTAQTRRDTVMDAISGFNHGVGGLVNRGLQLASPDGSALNNMATSSMNNMNQDYSQAQQSSPIAAKVGNVVGNVAGAAPIAAASTITGGIAGSTALANLVSGALAGGAIGGLNTNSKQSLEDQLLTTAGGAAVGGLGQAAIGSAIQGYKGLQLRSTNDPTFIPNLTKAIAQQAGVDPNNITGTAVRNGVNTLATNYKAVADAQFDKVGDLASSENALVPRTHVKNLIDNLTQQNQVMSSDASEQALTAAQKIYGNGVPVPYGSATQPGTAYNGLSQLRTQMSSAYNSGDYVGGNAIREVHDALNRDILNGTGSSDLLQAKTAADKFYSQQYIPIRNLVDGTDHLTDESFADKLINGLGSKQDTVAAYNQMPQQLQNQVYALHVKALQPTLDAAGNMNPITYAKNLQNATQQANLTPDLQSHINALNTLTKTLQYSGLANKFKPPANILDAASSPIQTAEMLPQTTYLTAAGRAMQNPDVRQLINTANGLGDNANQMIKDTIGKKIARIAWRSFGYGGASVYAANKWMGAESKPMKQDPDQGGSDDNSTNQ